MKVCIRVCPKCGEPTINEAPSSVTGWLVPATYYCTNKGCGYSGPIYVEIEKEELDTLRNAMNGKDSKNA